MKVIAPLPSFAIIIAVLAWAVEGAAQQPARRSDVRSSSPSVAIAPATQAADYTEQNVGGDQVVKFTGDELSGPVNGPYGTTVRALPGAARVGLIRPRMNFVSELLKSVENL